MTITQALEKLERLDPERALVDAVEKTIDQYELLNKKQLYDGKTKTGADLSPTYLEDPYFKSRESAQRYSDWKDKITPNSNRTPGVPNLFINGRFYNSWGFTVLGQKIAIAATDPNAAKIEGDFSNEIYGLDDENMDKYRALVKPLIVADIKAQYYG